MDLISEIISKEDKKTLSKMKRSSPSQESAQHNDCPQNGGKIQEVLHIQSSRNGEDGLRHHSYSFDGRSYGY